MRILFADDCADEIIDAGIDGVCAVSAFGSDGIGIAFELLVEAFFVGVKQSLFFGRKGRFVFEGIDELLRQMRGVSEGVHIRPFACVDGVSPVVSGALFESLETTDPSHVTIIVMEMFAALYQASFGVRTYHFFDVRGVFDFSHVARAMAQNDSRLSRSYELSPCSRSSVCKTTFYIPSEESPSKLREGNRILIVYILALRVVFSS